MIEVRCSHRSEQNRSGGPAGIDSIRRQRVVAGYKRNPANIFLSDFELMAESRSDRLKNTMPSPGTVVMFRSMR
jgi:hypothetical protein